MGNSEVGHNALGAGRVFEQGASLVNKALASGRVFQSETWQDIVRQAEKGGTIHFIGLLSDGNVHSHINQLYIFLDKCAETGIKKVA
jgi:2,3-bisphosphoglycerate-independent phosphoglycerate mutase